MVANAPSDQYLCAFILEGVWPSYKILSCYCDPGKAAEELGWTAENDIKEMCEDSWRWQKNNPNGYEGEE